MSIKLNRPLQHLNQPTLQHRQLAKTLTAITMAAKVEK
jgi:hypothetical protein